MIDLNFNKQSEFSPKKDLPERFCLRKWDYPVINLVHGHIRTCCYTPRQKVTNEEIKRLGTDVFLNRKYEQERRMEIISGKDHADCGHCVDIERQGLKSPRTGPVPYTPRVDGKYLLSDSPWVLELELGSRCDLKCIYCGPQNSSAWAHELVVAGEMSFTDIGEWTQAADPQLTEVFWQWFDQTAKHTICRIKFLGGEPTLYPELVPMMSQMIELLQSAQRKDLVEFVIITNLNCHPKRLEQIHAICLRPVKGVRFRIQPSLESLGARASFIRYPLNWARFENNIRSLLEGAKQHKLSYQNFCIDLQIALNALCVSSLPSFFSWVNQLTEEFDFAIGLLQNIVSHPSFLNPHILPSAYAAYLQQASVFLKSVEEKQDQSLTARGQYGGWSVYRSHLIDPLCRSIAKNPASGDLQGRQELTNFLRQLEQRRSVDFISIFPEYADLLYLRSSIK